MKKIIWFLMFCATLLSFNAKAQKVKNHLDNKVDSLFSEYNINSESPGTAVLIVKDKEVILQKCFGLANIEYKQPITSSTVFDLASLSKQFTGMAISMLIEQQKISYDDDIRKYIPEVPDFGKKITIGHLLHHTSGLRDWTSTLSLAGWKYDNVISFSDILNMAFNQQDLNFDPGSEYTYSNTGYNLLAELVQRVTGLPFSEWMDINIFKPLEMTNTHFQDDHSKVIFNKAYSYKKQKGEFHAVNNGLTALGSSSLFSTIEDLAKWVIHLDDPKIIGKPVVDRMFQQGQLNDGSRISYAYGLRVDKYKGMKRISHSGSWASFNTYIAYFPEEHLSIVVLQNTPANAYKVTHDLADLYLTNDEGAKRQKTEAPEFINLPVPVLEKHVGIYRLDSIRYFTVSRNNNQLRISASFESSVPLNAISDSVFWAYNSRVIFYKDKSKRIGGLYYKGVTCPKLHLEKELSNEFTGEYISEELKTIYRISIENGQLIANHIQNGKISLTPLCNNDFKGSAWYMERVQFYRGINGKIAGFLVSTNRSRKQFFKKQELLMQK